MTSKPWLVACFAIFTAAPALAQSPTAKPLDLNLPLHFAAPSATTTQGKAKSAQAPDSRKHGAPPDDPRYADLPPPYAFPPDCNNKAYKKPRVFGNVALGAFSGSGIEGNYQATTVSIAKALGSCSHPSGGITFSFGFGRETVNGPGWRP